MTDEDDHGIECSKCGMELGVHHHWVEDYGLVHLKRIVVIHNARKGRLA